jgi:hypothetical protein
MKKLILMGISLVFFGCVQNQPQAKVNPKTEIKLIKKYGITQDALINYKNFYYFSNIEPNGISVNKLDKNYNLVSKKVINILIEPKKYLVKNNHFYIFGYDNSKQKPVILDFDLNTFKLIKTLYVGKKYSTPADFFIKKDIYSAINVFNKKTQSDIYIYKNTTLFSKIASNKKESVKFIYPIENNFLIIGNIYFTNYDICLLYTSPSPRD